MSNLFIPAMLNLWCMEHVTETQVQSIPTPCTVQSFGISQHQLRGSPRSIAPIDKAINQVVEAEMCRSRFDPLKVLLPICSV